MSAEVKGQGRERPPTELIAIELGMIVFVVTIIVTSHLTLGRSARLVPLIVSYPTLALIVYQFLSDLGFITRVHRSKSPDDEPEGSFSVDLDAAMHVLDEEAGEDDDIDMRRYAIFGVWSVGFVVLAALTSFLVAVPVALLVILREATGNTIRAIAIVAPTSIGLYLIFDTFLQVPW